MTTIESGRLPDTLQTLVDARLDTIDRMLLGRVHRQDRLAIVREVESQIHDLLGERDAGSLDRDDVLAILARLDPPEAYLPDDLDAPGPARYPTAPRPPRAAPTAHGRFALPSGVLGLISLALLLMSTLIVLGDGFDLAGLAYILIFGSIGLTLLTGLLAVVLAGMSRLRGPWAVVGLVTGIVSLLLGTFGFLILIFN